MNDSNWLFDLGERLNGTCAPGELRGLHAWMWNSWKSDGSKVAEHYNSILGLSGDDKFQPDFPNLFVGQPESAKVVFVNINPGWNPEGNKRENSIVSSSEESSWSFCREFFTEYPRQCAKMNWWNQAIGIAIRIEGADLLTAPPQRKREWANKQVSGWELLPIHSSQAGFQNRHGSIPPEIYQAMKASLAALLRISKHTVIVSSKAGSDFLAEIAAEKAWTKLTSLSGKMEKCNAYCVGGRLVLGVPRQLVNSHQGIPFKEVVEPISAILAKMQSDGIAT